ncbi:MAG: putative zinc-binding protein [Fibrobacteria bacterium]|nr:putative zinc-binding protein [Fibrobacteria bacterium]
MACTSCSTDPSTLIYSCSGAADVGEVADRVARALAREGLGKMSCAVGVGAGIQSLRHVAVSAGRILAIDGCATRCVERALGEVGVESILHVELGSRGFPKGGSPASDENVGRALALVRERLNQP